MQSDCTIERHIIETLTDEWALPEWIGFKMVTNNIDVPATANSFLTIMGKLTREGKIEAMKVWTALESEKSNTGEPKEAFCYAFRLPQKEN